MNEQWGRPWVVFEKVVPSTSTAPELGGITLSGIGAAILGSVWFRRRRKSSLSNR